MRRGWGFSSFILPVLRLSYVQAFAEYGEIEEGAVITDRMTGRSRGFGFVTFTKSESAYRALREGSKMIDVSFLLLPPTHRPSCPFPRGLYILLGRIAT